MSPALIITRGLPGCGKTTKARAWAAADPTCRARVNRDDLRSMLHATRHFAHPNLQYAAEQRVTRAQRALVAELLAGGVDVVVDDTNLPQRVAREFRQLADTAGAHFEVWDLTDVPLETCLERNAIRAGEDRVPDKAIISVHERYLRGKPYPLPYPSDPVAPSSPLSSTLRPYTPAPGTPRAIMVDIDGTVALTGERSPYDETRVGEDTPNWPVIDIVRAMHSAGHAVIFCSGRTSGCREATEKWLAQHVTLPYTALHMRAVGDQRKDSIIKAEIFDAHIRDQYTVVAVLDDRRQVVEHWRALGLTVFQVAEGAF